MVNATAIVVLMIVLGCAVAMAAAQRGPGNRSERPPLEVPEGAEVLAAPTPATRPAQVVDAANRQSAKQFEGEITVKVQLDYLLALPAGYEEQADRHWPLVVFLHGAGERGDDVERVANWGPPRMIREGRDFGAIVVSPQCPEGSWWTSEIEALSAMLNEIEQTYRVDPDRIYLTGLSMGGFGTMAWAAAETDRFAAIAAICGGGNRQQAQVAAKLPAWLFHGTADEVVPASNSVDLYNWMKAAGGEEVRLTLYDGVGHNSWSAAYADDRLWKWLFEQRRGE